MPKSQRFLSKHSSQAPDAKEFRRAQERLVRLKLQYELLDQRIARVEEGIERPDGSIASLLMRREGLKYDMECQYRRLLAG
ncbi:hypothetical protein D3C76_604320 [compost metagenome]